MGATLAPLPICGKRWYLS